eukprot:15457708-Alexandrium_andersonii.AAC.1
MQGAGAAVAALSAAAEELPALAAAGAAALNAAQAAKCAAKVERRSNVAPWAGPACAEVLAAEVEALPRLRRE